VSIAGVLAVASGLILYWVLFYYPAFGIQDKVKFFAILAGLVVVAVAYYWVVKAVRMRGGVDIGLAYAEIPPE
jgi:uncharacterized membrane protein YbhN (UPF0104 family)